MKHWQFYLAILLLVVLLFPMHEGMESKLESIKYPFELTPEQKQIKHNIDTIIEVHDELQKTNSQLSGYTTSTQERKKEILVLEDEIIRTMSPIQMKKIPPMQEKHYTEMYKITNLTLDQIHNMTPKEIEALNEPHFSALLRRIAKLNDKLTPAQISGLSQSRIKFMSQI